MSGIADQADWKVNIYLQAAGPIKPRTKYKTHKLLSATSNITLPFVPYPGLYLTFSQPAKRGRTQTLYLRVRIVEWNVIERQFECVVDEMLRALLFSETYEVRGPVRTEEHFVELQKTLRAFGFEVSADAANPMMALDKDVDGTRIDQL